MHRNQQDTTTTLLVVHIVCADAEMKGATSLKYVFSAHTHNILLM